MEIYYFNHVNMKKFLRIITVVGIFALIFYSLTAKAETENLNQDNSGEAVSSTTPVEETPTTTPTNNTVILNEGGESNTSTFSQTNRVTVNYLNEIIFDGNIITTGTDFCDDNNTNFSSASTTALGALAAASKQNNFALNIKNYGGTSYYVSGIGNHAAEGFDGWVYTVNMADPGWVGINDYILNNNDWLTVYYSLWPWKLEVNTTTITAGQNAIFTAYNYSSSTWNTSPSTSISIGNEIFTTDANGEYSYSTTTTGAVKAFIYGSSDWPQNSPAINLNIIDIVSTTTSSTPISTTTNNGSSNSGGSGTDTKPYIKTSDEIQTAIKTINDYIKSNEDNNGKIVDGPTTDWAIMSLVAAGTAPDNKTAAYAYNYNFDDGPETNLCANYPRHLLALKALGYQNTDSRIQNLSNYVITNCYKNNLYGLSGINDDVFGLIALLNTGTNYDSPIIQSIIQTIIKDQTANGAFTWDGYEGADITGAAINALKHAEANGATIDHNIYSTAENYLKLNQLNDGGWGYDNSDALTTSWVVMGINALGENPQTWVKNEHTPYSVLINTLNDSGYYEPSYAPGTVDWFGEKHAVVALTQKTWPISPISVNTGGGSSAADNNTTTTVTSSTIATSTIITTSTLDIPTSTLITTTTPAIDIVTILEKTQSTPTIKITIAEKPKTPENKILKTYTDNTPKSTSTFITQNNTPNTSSLANDSINDTPMPSPLKKYAKIILGISGGGGTLIGLYLAFKFFKNIV